MYAPGRRWRPQEKTTNPSNNHLTIKKEYFIMKKVISLVLSVMMMLTMFAGCKVSSTAETAAPTAAPTSSTAAETSADTTPAVQEFNVAIVQQLDHASLDEIRTAIVAQLQKLAEGKGVKVNIQEFNGQNDATVLNQIGAQVVGDGVDLIIPIATLAAQCMVTAADGTDIPIVYAAISDPEAAGLTGLSNVTGTSDALNTAFILDMMLAANPDIKTVGLLYSNSEANSTTPIAEAKAYLQEKQIDFVEKTGNTSGEVVEAAASMVGRVDAVFTPTDNVVMAAEVTVAETLNEAGIPHYTGADSFVAAGAFATCGVNYTELGTYTADMAMDILLGGTVPEFHVMDGGIITVNTETGATLGIDYSAFASMANTVVEVKTGE